MILYYRKGVSTFYVKIILLRSEIGDIYVIEEDGIV